ncbi:MAG TPA: hypothetical protein VK507_10360 [Iamia sp.]|nr:hypothetical protein [Iamia sp.]
MPERSCPSCHEPVAAHQTLCPSCRTPVPSEAGPVAADSSAFTFTAPPPRQARPSDSAPDPAAPDATDSPAPDLAAPGAVASDAPAWDAAAPDSTVSPAPDPAAPGPVASDAPAWDAGAAPAEAPAWEPGPAAAASDATTAFGPAPAEVAAWEAAAAPAPVWEASPGEQWSAPSDPGTEGPFVAAPEPTASVGETTTAYGGAGVWQPAPGADVTWAAAPTTTTAPTSARPVRTSAGTLGTPGAAVLDERGNLPGGVAGLVAAALVTVGVFLPWIGVEGQDVSGWSASGDAKVLLGVAGIATVIAALLIGGARSLVLRLAMVGLGIVALGLGAFEVSSAGGIDEFDVSLGTGLFIVLAGGVALAVSGVLTRHKRFR